MKIIGWIAKKFENFGDNELEMWKKIEFNEGKLSKK